MALERVSLRVSVGLSFDFLRHTLTRSHTHTHSLPCSPARFQSGLLLGGASQVLFSLLAGFVDTSMVAWPAMLIKTHVLFMFNGCLALLLGLLTPEMMRSLDDTQLKVWAVGSQLGTFFNGAAHAYMAYTGKGAALVKSMTPINGYSSVANGMLYFCAVNILVAAVLTVFGLWKNSQ